MKSEFDLSDLDDSRRLVGMQRHPDSHLDHGLTEDQIAFLFELFASRDSFFIETVDLPPGLGTVPCSLYGPSMGDAPVIDPYALTLAQRQQGLMHMMTVPVFEAKRAGRDYPSRLVSLPPRPTNKVTVIAGPHDGLPCVLFTAFGGPLAPKEANDPTLTDDDREASVKFWAVHALALDGLR